MAQGAQEPIVHLKPADGAIGAHFEAVREAYKDFKSLALRIAQTANLQFSSIQMSLLE